MTEEQAKERAYGIMAVTLPLSWIEVAGTNKITPKAVKLRDHLAKVLLQVEAQARAATWDDAADVIENMAGGPALQLIAQDHFRERATVARRGAKP